MSGLSNLVSHWDQSRVAQKADYWYEDDAILIATDFECGSGADITELGQDTFGMRSQPEPGHDHPFAGKSTYFCVGVHNKLEESRRVQLVITEFTHDLDQVKYITVRQGHDHWYRLPLEDVVADTESGQLRLGIDLPPFQGPDSVLFLCNFRWHPYTDMAHYLRSRASECSFATLRSIGSTHGGREILALEIGERSADRPRIAVAQTPQPSESGHWSCRSVIDFLLSDDPQAESIRARTFVSIIPHSNPDGTVLGHAMVNALGQNPYFDADRAVAGLDASVESLAMWDHLRALRPWLYLEFHSAFQDYRKQHAILPYDKGLSSDPGIQILYDRCDAALAGIPGNFIETVTSLGSGYTGSMGYMAGTRLGVVPYMYKLQDKFPHQDNLAHALEVFRALEQVKHQEPR